MAKKRQGEPWISGAEYGRRLPPVTINLIVADVDRSVAFYRDVLDAKLHYSDPDFAAFEAAGVEFMLHADHTYENHPWHADLVAGRPRGLGAEIRLLGADPDGVESRAIEHGATVVRPATDKAHGWREMMVADPDGYIWAIGIAI